MNLKEYNGTTKENKKEFENNGKQMVCFINRTPPRMRERDLLFLYTNAFDGLILFLTSKYIP